VYGGAYLLTVVVSDVGIRVSTFAVRRSNSSEELWAGRARAHLDSATDVR
jgi:hypothetical protein